MKATLQGCKQLYRDISSFTGMSAILRRCKQFYGDISNFMACKQITEM